MWWDHRTLYTVISSPALAGRASVIALLVRLSASPIFFITSSELILMIFSGYSGIAISYSKPQFWSLKITFLGQRSRSEFLLIHTCLWNLYDICISFTYRSYINFIRLGQRSRSVKVCKDHNRKYVSISSILNISFYNFQVISIFSF